MNKDLLFQLYAIHSPSGNEKKMRKFLRKQAIECGATSVETDKHGNLLIVKGVSDTYPCLAAHIDQVQKNHSKDFKVVEIDGDVIGWSAKCHSQQGLGADDKNGIFICLELLKKFDVMKVAFFVGEEVGCKGSGAVDLEFFKDCRFIIEPDRKDSSDLITSMFCGDVCSVEFADAIGFKDYGYEHEQGSITDVGELVDRGVGISCLNLSCGYYDAHTDHEYTVLSELENCLNFVKHIVATCTDVYPFVSDGSFCSKFGGGSYYDWYGDRGYGRGLYGSGYGYYGGKRYDSGRESIISDEELYYNEGAYEQDYTLMEETLKGMPDIDIEWIKVNMKSDFWAYEYLTKMDADGVLEDMYYEIKSYFDDDEVVGTIELKKVS